MRMMSVSILVNGHPIYTRSVVNITRKKGAQVCIYKLDTGENIYHAPNEGAVPLAIKMLESIHEVL